MLSDSFAVGHINLDGTARKSGICYSASASFHAEITLSMSNGQLTSSITLDQPQVDVDIKWYCWVAIALTGGVLGVAVLATLNALFDADGGGILQGIIGNQLGNQLPAWRPEPAGF